MSASEDLALLDRWWRAANYLSVGQIYLLDNALLRRPLAVGGHQAAAARPLGDHPRPQPALDPPQPADPRARRRRDLPGRAGARRPGRGGQRLARGHLQRGLPARRRRRAGDARAVPAVLVPGRDPEPRRAGDPRLHPRGRRARLRPLPCVRRRDGQPGPGRRRGGRRRRVRDRSAGHLLARQQVRGPGPRRGGAADPAPQRLQDRQPGHPRPDPAARAREPDDRLRPRGAHRRGRRPDGRAPAAGGGARHRARPDPRDPARRPRGRRPRAPPVADDPAGHPQGLDRPGRRRRRPGRGHLAGAPGAAGRHPRRRRPPGAARGVDAVLRPRHPLRRRRPAAAGAAGAGARGHPPDEREPARQRRPAPPAARAAGLPQPRGRGDGAGGHLARGHPGARPVPRRRGPPQRRQLPDLRAGRDRLQPARRGLRGDRQGLRRRDPGQRRAPRPVRPGGRDALRAHLPGLAGGLPAHRPARAVQLLRGVHPPRRLDAQPARQVAEDDPRHRVAPADRLAQLPAHLARLAPGPQRVLPPGPRLHRPRGQQEGRGGPGLPAAGHQHAAVDDAALPGQRALRQRGGGRQAAVVRLAGRRGRGPALRAGAGDLGLGLLGRRRPGRGAGLRRRRTDARGAGRDRAAARAPAFAEGAVRERGRPDAAPGLPASTRTG